MAPVDTANIAQHLVQVDNERFYLGTRQGEPARHRHALVDNLTHMISLVRARGAQVYLLTYPSHWGFYPGANQRLKEAAGINKAPLIDITPLFIARCPDGPPSCQDLLFHDGHATAQGNALVAETIQTFLHARWPAIQDSSSAVP